MAGTQPERSSKEKLLHVLGDWVAPLIAFVVIVGILLALISVLLESAR